MMDKVSNESAELDAVEQTRAVRVTDAAHEPAAGHESGGDRGAGGRSRRRTRTALDPLSKAIIEQLQQDGRRAYATIGKAVGPPRRRCASGYRSCRTAA
jgi:hypothetical protein